MKGSISAGIYARISSDDGSALGVERQKRDCSDLAKRNGWTVVEQYVDNDVSASSGKPRPEYLRMMRDVEAGRIGALVVWDVDRLTRSPRELEDVIDHAERAGLRLASVGGDIDLATEQGRMMARMKGTVAKYEVEQSSRRLRRKFQERAEAGKPHGKVAYGYRRVPVLDEGGKVVETREELHEEQAAVIRDATRRMLAGESLRSVASDLERRGVEPPRGQRPDRRPGEVWQPTKLRQILTRERNCGRRVHKGQVIGKGEWPAIVSEDEFDRLMAIIRDPGRRTSRGSEVKYLLSGIARCGRGECGGVMRSTVGGRYGGRNAPAAYTCANCFRVRRKRDDVDEVVNRVIVARLSAPDGPSLLGGDPETAKAAADEAAALEARLALAADDYAEGGITGDQLRRITAKLRPRIEDAKRRARQAAPATELQSLVSGDVGAAWEAAPMDVRRTVVDLLLTVTVMPVGSGGRFDPESIIIEWKS